MEAIACDMNSDFQEAFEERCDHISVVFDYFHIVKNLNEKVISAVRKDEQRRLYSEGKRDEARRLKRSKYILCSSHKTLEKKDEEAGKTIVKASPLFGRDEKKAKGGNVERYEELINSNKLLFTADLVKEMLRSAYAMTDEAEMAGAIADIMDTCDSTGNEHFRWFSRLLDNHFEGIIAHATYRISSGKVEGINNKIKTIRRQGYGYPDDDYFFLKIFDSSRKSYVRRACKIVCVNGKCYCLEGEAADDQERHKGKGCNRSDSRPAGPAWNDAGGAVRSRRTSEEAHIKACEQST